MKLATLKNGSRDGRLVVVSRDLGRAVDATAVAPTMQFAIEHWDWVEAGLRALSDAMNAKKGMGMAGSFAFDEERQILGLKGHKMVRLS